MAPTNLGRELPVRIGAIVDHYIGMIYQLQNIFVRLARDMFRIGHVTKALVAVIYPISGSVIGMAQQCGGNLDTVAQGEVVTGDEILKHYLRTHGLDRNREIWLVHLPGHDVVQGLRCFEKMPRHDAEITIGLESR